MTVRREDLELLSRAALLPAPVERSEMEPDRWYEIRDELAVKLRELFSPLVLDAGAAVDVADVAVRETLGFPPRAPEGVLECRDCELPVSEGEHAGHIFGARDA